MKRSATIFILAAITVALFTISSGISGGEKGNHTVSYPEGYRDWTHVKSMVIQKGHSLFEAVGGIHHIYGNDKAVKAYMGGGPFPDGSVIVFDLFEAKAGDNAITEGMRKAVIVMEKESKRFASTGGWGYELFKGDTMERGVKDPVSECFNCHAGQKEKDFVFSTYRK